MGVLVFLVDGQKRYRRLIDILVDSFSISSELPARWELYHGTGQIIDGIHIGDPERSSGIRKYQILKIQRQSQMPKSKSMPMPCHSLRFSNSTQSTRIQKDKTYRVRPAPPANPWQSKQTREREKCTLHLTRLVPVVLSYQALIQRTSQGSVRHVATFDGFAWGNLLYGPII